MTKTCDVSASAWRFIRVGPSVALLMAFPCIVVGQVTANPYASVQYEHDSNVFRVPDSATATQFYGGPTLGDTDLRYIGGLEGTYLWSRQKLSATFEGRYVDYDHFSFLNHSEYLANIQLDWKTASLLDGILQFHQEHLAAYFADRQSPTLEVDTDRNIVGKANLLFHTDWRLETGVNFHTYESPLQFYPDFTEHEVGSHLGVSYLGVSDWTFGVAADHISGNFTNAVDVGPYSQTSEGIRFTYTVKGLTSVVGNLGYTRRSQGSGEDSLGTVTGLFRYTRQLTGKTSVFAQAERAVYSYAASAGSEIDTTESVGGTWQATYRLGVSLKYAYTRTTYAGEAIPGSEANGRFDHSPAASVNVVYQALKNLQVKAYLNNQSRNSNVHLDNYSDNTVGVQVLAHWR